MKNVLIISGSPRKKGNSQRLCEEFKKELRIRKLCGTDSVSRKENRIL